MATTTTGTSLVDLTPETLMETVLGTDSNLREWNHLKNVIFRPGALTNESRKQDLLTSLATSFARSSAGLSRQDGTDPLEGTLEGIPFQKLDLGLTFDDFQKITSLRDAIRGNAPLNTEEDCRMLAAYLGGQLGVGEMVDQAIPYDPADPTARATGNTQGPATSFVSQYLSEADKDSLSAMRTGLTGMYDTCRQQPALGKQKQAFSDVIDAFTTEAFSVPTQPSSSQLIKASKELFDSIGLTENRLKDLSSLSTAVRSSFPIDKHDLRERKNFALRLRTDLIGSTKNDPVKQVLSAYKSQPNSEPMEGAYESVKSLYSKLVELKQKQEDETAATKLDNIVSMFAAETTGSKAAHKWAKTAQNYWKEHQNLFTDTAKLSKDTYDELTNVMGVLKKAYAHEKTTDLLRDESYEWLSGQVTDTASKKLKATTKAKQTKQPQQPLKNPIKEYTTQEQYTQFKTFASSVSTATAKLVKKKDGTGLSRFDKLISSFAAQSFMPDDKYATSMSEYIEPRKKVFESYGITEETLGTGLALANVLRPHYKGKDKDTYASASEWTVNVLKYGSPDGKQKASPSTNGDTKKTAPKKVKKGEASEPVSDADDEGAVKTSTTAAPPKKVKREGPKAQEQPSVVDASKFDTSQQQTRVPRIVELTGEETATTAVGDGTSAAPQTTATALETQTEHTRPRETVRRAAPDETTVPPPAAKKPRPPPRTTGTTRRMSYVSTETDSGYVPTIPQPAYQTTAGETTEDGGTVKRDTGGESGTKAEKKEKRWPFEANTRSKASQWITSTRATFRNRVRDAWHGTVINDPDGPGSVAWTGEPTMFEATKGDLTYREMYRHDGEHFRMVCRTERKGQLLWERDHDWEVKTGKLTLGVEWAIDDQSPDREGPMAEQYRDFERLVKRTGCEDFKFDIPFKMDNDVLANNGKIDYAKLHELPWKLDPKSG